DDDLEEVAKDIIQKNEDHIIVVDKNHTLVGIITTFDITKAVAYNKKKVSEIVTRKVISCRPEETLYELVNKLKKFNISALPVIDQKNNVLGIVSESMLLKNLVPKPNMNIINKNNNKKSRH
ncbi:MAG: CBS domain-containing protein, partial [Promethearchaeota archaeon]